MWRKALLLDIGFYWVGEVLSYEVYDIELLSCEMRIYPKYIYIYVYPPNTKRKVEFYICSLFKFDLNEY